MMGRLSRPRRVLSSCQDFSKALDGRAGYNVDTINIADRRIKHYSLLQAK